MFWRSDRPNVSAHASGAGLIEMTGARLALAALISFVLLSIACLYENFYDESYFSRWYAKVEIDALAAILDRSPDGSLTLRPGSERAHYMNTGSDGAYAYRIWNDQGHIVASANADLFDKASPVASSGAVKPDSWQHKFGEGWFEFVAGKRTLVGFEPVWIEVATRGDPAGVRFWALGHDFLHDVVRPLLPTFFVAYALSMLSLRRALRPVMAAAAVAEQLRPSADGTGELSIPTKELPHEVATLATAVNQLFSRVGELLNSQNEFIGRAAHQLRTPLATMLLQASKINSPAARELERDIEGMGDTVDRLLELARMQGLPPLDCGNLDVSNLAHDVAMDLQPFAQQRGGDVQVVDCAAHIVRGDYLTLREALRNLVMNGIVHHPGCPVVRVVCGPGPRLSVEDNGPGLLGIAPERLFEPFSRGRSHSRGAGLGLAIVKKVVDLHQGRIVVGSSSRGGAKFTIELVAGEQSHSDREAYELECVPAPAE